MSYIEIVSSGPAMGRRENLSKPQYIIGRHPECDIILENGAAVSRQHVRLFARNGGYACEDLGSRNGTFVNGKLINGPIQLQDGDSIRICDIELSYGDTKEQSSFKGDIGSSKRGGLGVLIDDEEGENDSPSVKARMGMDVRGSEYGFQLSASAESRLAALLEIMRNLGKTIGIDEVLPKVLDSLFSIFLQADRGFIILKDASDNLMISCVRTRNKDQEDKARPSRTVVREVMKSKEAIISLDAGGDFSMSESVSDLKIKSMIVAPLLNFEGEPLGVIQIDSTQTKGGFEEKDLEILIGVANQAGIAIENAQMHENLVAQKLVEQDLELASQVQLAFLPKTSPDCKGLSFYQYYNPAQQIGGDY
ncbi:MAG: FHA domain-containing protein, partial [Pirellula sp.]